MNVNDAIGRSLAGNPVFASLSEPHKELIAGCASLKVFQAGDIIYREGQPADQFYLIRHGRVGLETYVPGRAPIIVDTLREGDPVGWSWLIPPYRTHFDARALELTRVIEFDAACLRRKMEEDQAFGFAVYQRMTPIIASRLAAARRQMIDLYGRPNERGVAWR
ncbi:MAG: cyclic nucleotide-binding domain-containing protein [Rhodospirillales bacterium]|nr:cyclic nucleotide-binding domain-containing protein [Rhodospirillales bacterium]